MSRSDDCASNIHEFCGPCDCMCHGISISYKEAKYLVDSIQNEYLNKETYHFASALFGKLAKFVKDYELARQSSQHSQ